MVVMIVVVRHAVLPSLRFAVPIIVRWGAMRNTAERIAGSIDRVIAAIGRAATWCCLYIVLAEFAVVVMRYAFGMGSIRLQESVLYAHAALFMLAAAWTLQVGGHVRVDVFYAQASPRRRAVIDLIGDIGRRVLVEMLANFDVLANVSGGGVSAQADAVKMGISRALLEFNVELRKTLKADGLLSRDARIKERKKYGQKGARKRFQFSKR